MKVLHVCANPKPTKDSASKQLAAAFFSTLVGINPDIEICNVELYKDPPPYLSYEAIRGSFFPIYIHGYTATKGELQAMDYADLQAALFNDSDVLVLTMPMWNFTMPAIMKAWIDQLMLPGKVFTLDKDEGPMPLHRVQKLILLAASGGIYRQGDVRDSLSSEIERIFGWIGIEDIGVAWADGQDTFLYQDTEAHKQVAVEAAQELAEDVADLLG